MKQLLSFIVALVGLSMAAVDVEAARRLCGGGNLGMQRSAPPAPQKTAPSTAPQQQPSQAAPAAPAPQPQPSGLQKWLGPLAGLALGAGLAALFLNNGMAGLLAGLLVIGLIVAVMVFAARALLRGRIGSQQPLQYAGMPGTGPAPDVLPGGAGAHSVAATTSGRPTDFDAAEFIRHARLNFVRLQEAHDRRDLSAIRDFLTPDLYREIEADVRRAGEAPQKTEVTTLEAEVREVVEEGDSYIVSVRFSGLMREADGEEPAPFSETWHLVKPVRGRSGWLVAGIQQA